MAIANQTSNWRHLTVRIIIQYMVDLGLGLVRVKDMLVFYMEGTIGL